MKLIEKSAIELYMEFSLFTHVQEFSKTLSYEQKTQLWLVLHDFMTDMSNTLDTQVDLDNAQHMLLYNNKRKKR